MGVLLSLHNILAHTTLACVVIVSADDIVHPRWPFVTRFWLTLVSRGKERGADVICTWTDPGVESAMHFVSLR